MTQQNRLITYFVILASVLLVGWWGVPKQDFTPGGLLLPTGNSHFSAIAVDKVSVSTNPMLAGTNVGTLNVEYYAPSMDDAKVRDAENYAVQLAAAAGANNVVITGLFRDPSEKTIHLYGKAIRN